MKLESKIERVLGEIHSDELTALTADLVRINSVFDPAAGTCEQPVAEYVWNWAKREGFDVEMETVAPNRPNVVIDWRASAAGRRLMFEGHTDVVTPGELSDWTYDPFGAEIVGGRMYGRGTNDTKGNLAAFLLAVAALRRSGVPLTGSVVGGVLCDEEDRMTGVLDFINRGRADDITGAVICEPQGGYISAVQKGAVRAAFTVTGRMCHGAMPLTGLNTAPAVARIIEGLHRLEAEASEACGKDPLLGWPSFTPTVVRAPTAGAPQLNVVPKNARVLADIRTIPVQSHEQIREDLTALSKETAESTKRHYEVYDERRSVNRDRNISVSVEFITDRPCTVTDGNDPVVLSMDWAVRRVTGRTPEYAGVPGATDGTFLWSMKGIPIVTFGAGDRDVPHQVDEWVDLQQLHETAKIYALSALRYLTPDNG